MERAKELIDGMKFPTNEYDSFDNFKRLYACFTPDEWFDTNVLFSVTLYIAEKRPDLVDLGTRINVQVNLFLRTIKTFGDIPINNSDIGCFALTESNAGVLSGLVVDTKFEELESGDYILSSHDCKKRWISQGMFATKSLVFASNIHNHRDCRIFLVEMPYDGVTRTRMNCCTDVGKVLDLAEIQYTNVKLDKSAVLEKTIPLSRKELLCGIFYGRLCLAEVVITSISTFVDYVYNKVKGIEKFKTIGHYDYILNLNNELKAIKTQLISKRETILESQNVFLINCYKVYCVELAIEVYNKVHMMFGTHAFGFGLTYETLMLNKIAEGDTSVLKLAVIKEYLDSGGKLSWYHYLGLIYNYNRPKEYIMDNADNIFKCIVREYNVEDVLSRKENPRFV
jgi:hypothetical protein